MLTYFQCDLCHFWNAKRRDLTKFSQEDYRLVITICLASLEVFLVGNL